MSSATSTPGSAPKSMSSRLLTMKFMQRAAASSPTAPVAPTTDEPSPKRRKKDSDSPSKPNINVDVLADQRAVQAAVAAEEAKRQAALERQGAEAGDTRWVLSFEDQKGSVTTPKLAIRVVQAGYANLDVPQPSIIRSVEDGPPWEEKPVMVGRRSFGRFNKVLEKQQNPLIEDSSESESEDDDNEDEDSEDSSSESEDPTSSLIKASRQEAAERAKAERKAKKKAEKAQSLDLARQRKKKEVKLNGLTSLSGRQAPVTPRTCYHCGGPHVKSECPDFKCYNCGGPHLKANCPKRSYDGPQGGFSKKVRTSK